MGRKGQVVRARKEWGVSVGAEGLSVTPATPIAVFLLVGDQEEREELGIEPKVVRIHGTMFIKLGEPATRSESQTPNKFFWGIAIGRRDAFQDFVDTADPDGICEPFGDASESDFLMWGVEHLDFGLSPTWTQGTPESVIEFAPHCCASKQVKIDVRAQRRLEKEDCLYFVIEYVTGVDSVHYVDFDARLLMSQ